MNRACGPASEWDSLLSSAHVWHVDPNTVDAQTLERKCLAWLTPQEATHREKLLTPPLRHVYLLSRVLCRVSLSRYTGINPQAWTFTQNAYGKPSICSPANETSLQFNLTHTDGLIACVVTRAGEVGVDAEDTSREIDVEGVARLALSSVENDHFNKLPQAERKERLFEYWVLKEAYLKAMGQGLWKPLEEVAIHLDSQGHPAPIRDWQLTLHRPSPCHVAAVAVHRGRLLEPVQIDWRVAEECYKLASPS